MTDVIEFPSKQIRDWRWIEEFLRSVCQEGSVPQNMEDEVCDGVKRWYLQFSWDMDVEFSIPAPASTTQAERDALRQAVEKSVLRLRDKVSSFCREIVRDRVHTEVDLWRLRQRQT